MNYKKRIKKWIKEQKLLAALGAACLVSLIAMAIILANPKTVQAPFEAPTYEQSAEKGEPKVPENLGWKLLYQEGMQFKAGVCGNLKFEERAAQIYFTNPAENSVHMKLRITNEKGKILAESGLLRPGEYLKSIEFTKKPKAGQKINMKVMTYEPEDFTSAGSINLATTIQ